MSAAVCCNILSGGERAATEYANPLLLGFLAAIIVGVLIGRIEIEKKLGVVTTFIRSTSIKQNIGKDGQITYVRVDSYRVLGASFKGIPIPTPFIVAAIMVAFTALLLSKKPASPEQKPQ